MPYGIELSFNNKEESIELPVVPSSISISDAGNSATYDVLGLGEINVIKDVKLPEYTFSSLFPSQRYPFVTTDILLRPAEYVRQILSWHASKRPIRFIFVGELFEINTPASIEKFDWQEAAGSSDILFTLKLKHYRFHTARRPIAITQAQSPGSILDTVALEQPARPNDQQPPATYILEAGDTLWSVAKRFFDDGSRWPEIQRLNSITDAGIKRLQAGTALKLPGGAGNHA